MISLLLTLALAQSADVNRAGAPLSSGAVLVAVHDPSVLSRVPISGGRVLRGRGDVHRVWPAVNHTPQSLLAELRMDADVRWAHEDWIIPMTPHALPNDPFFQDQWNLHNTGQQGFEIGADMGVVDAWEWTIGEGQLISVIDTGVDPIHPDLWVLEGSDYVEEDGDQAPTSDDDAHGTAVAGLAAGRGDNGIGVAGVAHGADIMGIRLLGGSTSLGQTYEAFAESVDAGASVINNSWGWSGDCPAIPPYDVLWDMIDYAEEEGRDGLGSVVVFSSGNDNCDITGDGMQEHPAAVSVGATTGQDERQGYSNYGDWLDIVAPSGAVLSTDISGSIGYGDYQGDEDYTGTMGGTSASAPQVSGMFALMFAANPRLTAADAREVMCATAQRIDLAGGDYDENGWSPWYGCGRADAAAAVRAVFNLGPPETPELTSATELPPEATLLTWAPPVDPDDDPLTYRVRYWPEGDTDAAQTVNTDRTWVDLSGQYSHGDTLVWRVRAQDLYGFGEWSEEQTVAVTLPEVVPEPSTPEPIPLERGTACNQAPAGVAGWLALLAAVSVRRRRT